MRYYGEDLNGTHLPFNFELVSLKDWRAVAVKPIVDLYEASLPAGAWPNWVLGNHDRPRIASRVGPAQSRVAHMLLLTLRGTPTCYYGDELGMPDVEIPAESVYDPAGKDNPLHSRDRVRTPMQWNTSPQAGFSQVAPWLPLTPDYLRLNVEVEQADPSSFLAFFRQLITLRRQLSALSVGAYRSMETGNEQVFGYLREHPAQRILILLNFSDRPQALVLPDFAATATILCSTHLDKTGPTALTDLELRPNEGLLIQL